jgi:hypothetical protein
LVGFDEFALVYLVTPCSSRSDSAPVGEFVDLIGSDPGKEGSRCAFTEAGSLFDPGRDDANPGLPVGRQRRLEHIAFMRDSLSLRRRNERCRRPVFGR